MLIRIVKVKSKTLTRLYVVYTLYLHAYYNDSDFD